MKIADPMITARHSHSLVAYQQEIVFAVGGISKSMTLKSCEAFVTSKRGWKEFSPMRFTRESPGLLVQGDYLYVFGGRSGSVFLDTVERLRIEFDVWSSLNIKLPIGLSRMNLYNHITAKTTEHPSFFIFGG